MGRKIFVFGDRSVATAAVGDTILQWAQSNPGAALGGATGRSPIDVWSYIWAKLASQESERKMAFVDRPILFLDEYFGAYPSYYHWAHRTLRVGRGGFASHNVYTPRGCFFEFDRVVDSDRLFEILSENQDQWAAETDIGEDGVPPEIRINQDVDHPLLRKVRQSLADYDQLVRQHEDRLQLLGIGVGGAIETDPRAGGHIGFVEYGAASRASKTMLVRMASSTNRANAADFQLANEDGGVVLQPAEYAVTQGISTILSAAELLLMAWGESKSKAVERMLFGEPSPYNPAAWIQHHDDVTVFADQAALGEISLSDLEHRGWVTEIMQQII